MRPSSTAIASLLFATLLAACASQAQKGSPPSGAGTSSSTTISSSTTASTGSGSTAAATTLKTPSPAATSVASVGGLTVTLMARPERGPAGDPVTFMVTARESHEPGSLSYRLAYGDGATDQNQVPQLCRAGPGSLAQQTWQLTHRYRAAGTYSAAVTVSAGCTPDRATATVNLTIG